MNPIQSGYLSFLLRLWQVKGEGPGWRASLEDVQSGELLGFTGLAELVAYLQALTGAGDEEQAFSGPLEKSGP